MPSPTLIPNPRILHVEGFVSHGDSITIKMCSTQSMPACPGCGHRSRRIHSHYVRHLADLPWHGVAVSLELKVKKLFCDHASCPRKIFTERLPEVVHPHGRRTIRLEEVLACIGFTSGGEAGSRLSGKFSVSISADSILRRIRRAGSGEPRKIRILGIDEFAFRRGHRYGTILVDLEQGKPVDLLPDRNADTVAQWLKDHPEVEIISRDRSGSFAEASSRGAPQARQVVDRWHLLKNLGETLVRLLDRHSKLIKEASRSVDPVSKPQDEPPSAKPLTKAQQTKSERRQRRLERYEEVIELRAQGVALREIARKVGMDRRIVRRFIRADAFPEITRRKPLPSILDPYKPYLLRRWHEGGCHNTAQLWREISEQGFRGSASTLRRIFTGARPKKKTAPAKRRDKPKASRPPSSRQVAILFRKERKSLDRDQHSYLLRLLGLNPQLDMAASLAFRFSRMVKDREDKQLGQWIEEVEQSHIPDLKTFATGLRQDLAPVEAALSLPWSNGPVEGQINRLKTIKRQMYGRANFDLLRNRVLLAAS